MAATKQGPKCRKCGGRTYVTPFGTGRIIYCAGCSLSPGSCTCNPKHTGKHRKK